MDITPISLDHISNAVGIVIAPDIDVEIVKTHKDAVLPKYAHAGDSGMDLYSIEECDILQKSAEIVSTGLACAIPEGYEGQVRSKSGLALNQWITVLNSPGTIDSCYRGEIKVILFNHHNSSYHVQKGQKIAQLVFTPVVHARWVEVVALQETPRGGGGFGSTGY